MNKQIVITVIIALGFISFSCSRSMNKNTSEQKEKENMETIANVSAGPKVIIYKTSEDYFDKVPVTLSEDKSKIVSFPGIKDVYFEGELAYPTRLINGFLLDNRGINENSAFLKLTYEEYSNLDKTPEVAELFTMIVNDNPFTEMYNCGKKFDYKDLVTELNDQIGNNELDKFKKLK